MISERQHYLLLWVQVLSANPTIWSNTLNNSSGKADNCLSVFDRFVGLALKGLIVIVLVLAC